VVGGPRRFSWSQALDSTEGVLSKHFVREFNEDAVSDAETYAEMAASCYCTCSEFLHGKAHYTQTLPETLNYSSVVLEAWLDLASRAAKAVLFLIYCRYGQELLPHAHDGQLGATMEHSFGHLSSIRRMLGLPVDEESRSVR
jgi:hypothetical protein